MSTIRPWALGARVLALAGVILTLATVGCPPGAPPVPPPPDASDAAPSAEGAPAPVVDAAPPPAVADAAPTPPPLEGGTTVPISATCASACTWMAGATLNCNTVLSNCGQTLTKIQSDGLTAQSDGGRFGCGCVMAATTPAAVAACGIACNDPSLPPVSSTSKPKAAAPTGCHAELCGGADTGEGFCSCNGARRCWKSPAACAVDLACCSAPGANCAGSADPCARKTRSWQASHPKE